MNTNLIEFKDRNKKMQMYKRELRKKATPAEKAFKLALRSMGIKYLFQRPFHSKEFRCIADFFFGHDKINVIVEIDGGYHLTNEQLRKDQYRTNWLIKNRNCKIIRFTNDQVLETPNDCILKLAKFYLSLVGQRETYSNNYFKFKNIIN